MKIDAYIKKWLESWIISQDQAKIMFSDSREIIESEKKNRVAWMFGTIWASVLWIWLLLFVGGNWEDIPLFLKVLAALWLCVASAYGAYFFEEKWDRPKTSWTLAFLSSIFWWVTVILIAQQYSTWDTSKIHYLILIWMLGVIPAIYAFNSAATAWLFSVLVIWWAFSYVMSFNWDSGLFTILAAWFILYWIWWLHKLIPDYMRIWRVFRIIGLYITMFVFLVFSVFSNYEFSRSLNDGLNKYILVFIIAAILISLSGYFARKSFNRMLLEHVPPVIWLWLSMWALVLGSYINSQSNYYYDQVNVVFLPVMVAMNIYIVVICTLVLWVWYSNRDSKLVNAGYFFWTIYLIIKYCQIWWWMMSASFFFIAWGILFLIFGYFVERKRRETITNFKFIWQDADL
ncbi:MAG: hypothetical protein ACD_3C00046G0004 [uncultured bacterium (gcode 4)]|uniref:DUF2157 domain-containing protein n=1 Tax=uncultured bacterium (gcode 4) TaxID=1234023 RepID=K2FBP3_9BACT|nr:MAG: hypothetical protein ACD_3C00046G0004 [uncultured bacterium (gcode 4)]